MVSHNGQWSRQGSRKVKADDEKNKDSGKILDWVWKVNSFLKANSWVIYNEK